MTIKLQDIYGLSAVDLGGIVPDPAAGISQSITAADPADVPLELTPAAGQTAALLKANGHDIIDKDGGLIVPSAGMVTTLIVNTPQLTFPGTGNLKQNVSLAGAKTDLPEGLYLLSFVSSVGGTSSGAVISAVLEFAALANTDFQPFVAGVATTGPTLLEVPYSFIIPMTVSKGMTADFSAPGWIKIYQGSGTSITNLRFKTLITAFKLASLE